MVNQLHSTVYWACDYLYMTRFELISVSERGPVASFNIMIDVNYNKTQLNATLVNICEGIVLV